MLAHGGIGRHMMKKGHAMASLEVDTHPPGMQWCDMDALDTVPVPMSSAEQKHASL